MYEFCKLKLVKGVWMNIYNLGIIEIPAHEKNIQNF